MPMFMFTSSVHIHRPAATAYTKRSSSRRRPRMWLLLRLLVTLQITRMASSSEPNYLIGTGGLDSVISRGSRRKKREHQPAHSLTNCAARAP